MLRYKIKLLICIFLFFPFSCKGQVAIDHNELGTLDLSKDLRSIVFSYKKSGLSKIYIATSSGDSLRIMQESLRDTSYVAPKFSYDSKHILYLAFPSSTGGSNIFLLDRNGKNKKQLTFQNDIITEAVFSQNSQKIYFVKAKSYNKYSPIGRKAPHDQDIYEYDLFTGNQKQITYLKAYSISNLSEIFSGKYILSKLIGKGANGMYIIDIKDPSAKNLIVPRNNPSEEPSRYGNPSFSEDVDRIAFTAPYELYVMDLKSTNAKLVYRPKDKLIHMYNVILFDKGEKILFINRQESSFHVINSDGSNMRKFSLRL